MLKDESRFNYGSAVLSSDVNLKVMTKDESQFKLWDYCTSFRRKSCLNIVWHIIGLRGRIKSVIKFIMNIMHALFTLRALCVTAIFSDEAWGNV